MTPELAVVQDADRLDAIGASGIARCFTYGGAKNRAIYDPSIPPVSAVLSPLTMPKVKDQEISKESYVKSGTSAPTINHFYDKLLKIKDRMKTKSGRALAEKRFVLPHSCSLAWFAPSLAWFFKRI